MSNPPSSILNDVLAQGKSSTSLFICYPGFEYFSVEVQGSMVHIAYIDTLFTWVGASEPVGPSEHHGFAIMRFFEAARAKRKKAVLLPVSAELAERARSFGFNAIQIGSEPWYSTYQFDAPKIAKQAQSRGAKVESFSPSQFTARERVEFESVIQSWLDSRKSATLEFLNQVRPWTLWQHKRYFKIKMNGRLVAFLAANPVPALKSWYLVDLIRTSHSPLGTTELLVQSAIEAFKLEHCDKITLGMSPLVPVEDNERKHHPFLYSVLDFTFYKLNFFYNFKSLHHFKEKLKPNRWEPLYLITPDKVLGPRSLLGLFTAIFPQGPVLTLTQTVWRLIKRTVRSFDFSRFLSDKIVTRSNPKSFSEILFRTKVTFAIIATNLLFFFASTTSDFTLRENTSSRFGFNLSRYLSDGMNTDDLRSLFLYAFLHWNLVHLLVNMTFLILLVSLTEIYTGSVLVISCYAVGAIFANPITSLSLHPLLRFVNQDLANSFLHESDVGSSLGIFSVMGALAYFSKHTRLILIVFSLGVAITSVLNSSILDLNHLTAMAIGYIIARGYVKKGEVL